jgi:hypothetical protein
MNKVRRLELTIDKKGDNIMNKNFFHKGFELFKRSRYSSWICAYLNIGRFIGINFGLTINVHTKAVEYDLVFLCVSFHGHFYFCKADTQ